MKAADLFAGAGGFSTGARLASLARYEFRECVQHSQAVAMGGGL